LFSNLVHGRTSRWLRFRSSTRRDILHSPSFGTHVYLFIPVPHGLTGLPAFTFLFRIYLRFVCGSARIFICVGLRTHCIFLRRALDSAVYVCLRTPHHHYAHAVSCPVLYARLPAPVPHACVSHGSLFALHVLVRSVLAVLPRLHTPPYVRHLQFFSLSHTASSRTRVCPFSGSRFWLRSKLPAPVRCPAPFYTTAYKFSSFHAFTHTFHRAHTRLVYCTFSVSTHMVYLCRVPPHYTWDYVSRTARVHHLRRCVPALRAPRFAYWTHIRTRLNVTHRILHHWVLYLDTHRCRFWFAPPATLLHSAMPALPLLGFTRSGLEPHTVTFTGFATYTSATHTTTRHLTRRYGYSHSSPPHYVLRLRYAFYHRLRFAFRTLPHVLTFPFYVVLPRSFVHTTTRAFTFPPRVRLRCRVSHYCILLTFACDHTLRGFLCVLRLFFAPPLPHTTDAHHAHGFTPSTLAPHMLTAHLLYFAASFVYMDAHCARAHWTYISRCLYVDTPRLPNTRCAWTHLTPSVPHTGSSFYCTFPRLVPFRSFIFICLTHTFSHTPFFSIHTPFFLPHFRIRKLSHAHFLLHFRCGSPRCRTPRLPFICHTAYTLTRSLHSLRSTTTFTSVYFFPGWFQFLVPSHTPFAAHCHSL